MELPWDPNVHPLALAYHMAWLGDFEKTKILPLSRAITRLWKRFIDDVFFIYTDSEEKFKKSFLKVKINDLHSTIKFTFECSKIHYLDINLHR